MTPADERMTPERREVHRLYVDRGIVPVRGGFRCPNLPSCSSSAQLELVTGTWAYVGSAYGQAQVHGRPARILFVAMDRGGFHGPDEENFADTQCIFRSVTEVPQNAHMGGVHWLMRELVDEKDPTVFSQQYALTNALKCARETKEMGTTPRARMIHNCSEHLRAEINVLAPHLVVTQGGHPADTTRRLFPDLRDTGARFTGDAGEANVLVGSRFVVLTTPHPARRKGWPWKRGPLPRFLCDAVDRARGEFLTLTAASPS